MKMMEITNDDHNWNKKSRIKKWPVVCTTENRLRNGNKLHVKKVSDQDIHLICLENICLEEFFQ